MAEYSGSKKPFSASTPRRIDPMIEYFMQFVNVGDLRENLKLTVTERFEKHERRIAERRTLDSEGGT